MKKATKNSLVEALKSMIEMLENGFCDDLTDDEYDDVIDGITKILTIKNKKHDNGTLTATSHNNWWSKCINCLFTLLQRK